MMGWMGWRRIGGVGGRVCVTTIATFACVPASREDDVPAASTGISSIGTGESGGTTDDVGTDWECEEHYECGALMCFSGRCYGCSTFEDCPHDLLCWLQECIPASEVPQCLAIAAPTCGDGLIGALEECDGTPGCSACQYDEVFESWLDDEAIESFKVLPDGGFLTIGPGPEPLTRRDASGAVVWSAPTEHQLSYTSDAAGKIYAGGLAAPGGTWFPYLQAHDEGGEIEWSVLDPVPGHHDAIVADDTRVLVGGTTEQANSPSGRGLLAQYTTDGALLWSRKLVEWHTVGAIVADGSEANVLGVHLYPPIPWTLMRIDADGETMWSAPIAAELTPIPDLSGVTMDGAGGTWIFGERVEGPWATRYGATGVELETIECFAGTTGWFTHLAVGPEGVIAVAVLVTPGPLPLTKARPWIALIEGGAVTRGIAFGEDDRTERLFDLAWRADGRLMIGVERIGPDEMHVVVVEP